MNTFRLELTETLDFHRRLAVDFDNQRAAYAASLAAANQSMREQRINLPKKKQLETPLSALFLRDADYGRLRDFAQRLHEIVEKILDITCVNDETFSIYFPDQTRLLPFLATTRGSKRRQFLSRYDVAVRPDGQLQVMELNTSCPGGFMIAEAISLITLRGLQRLNIGLAIDPTQLAVMLQEDLVDGLLSMEKQAGIEKGAIGVLSDENELTLELDLLAAAFRRRDREVYLGDARKLTYENGELRGDGMRLSAVYNKFRISTPQSQNHCWKDGFESRYADLLAAQQQGDVVFLNNLYGMAVAEDKGLLAIMHDSEVQSQLSKEDQEFIAAHIPWTTRFADSEVSRDGNVVSLIDHVRNNRERYVLKPAHEGRGYRVSVGKHCTEEQWQAACELDPHCPTIAQEYVDTMSLPVVFQRNGDVAIEDMYLTLGLAVVDGDFQGVISRVSTNPVTNAARDGFVQAAFVGETLYRPELAVGAPVGGAGAIKLDNTLRLHKRLESMLPKQSELLRSALKFVNRKRAEGENAADLANEPMLSALILSRGDVHYLKLFAETIHTLLERTLDRLASDAELRTRWFDSLEPLAGQLVKSPGAKSWQSIGCYEAIVTPRGRLRIASLHSLDPATLFTAAERSRETLQGFRFLSRASGLDALQIGSATLAQIVDTIFAIERQANSAPDLIAIRHSHAQSQSVCAETGDSYEALKSALKSQGRDVEFVTAGELTRDDQGLKLNGQRVSLVVNELATELGVATASNEAVQSITDPFIGNLVAHRYVTDERFLAMLQTNEGAAHLSPAERVFLNEHVSLSPHDDSALWLPVIRNRDGDTCQEAMKLTLRLAVLEGEYQGVASRLAATNDPTDLPQAVFVVGKGS